MGATSAVRIYQIVENLYSILAVELLTATQALRFKRPFKTSSSLEHIVNNYREEVMFIEQDRILHEDILRSEQFIKNHRF